MKLIRNLLWIGAGACFFTGMVSSIFFILLPAAVILGVLAAVAGNGRPASFWLAPASLGAAIAALVLYGLNPDSGFFILAWIFLLSLAVGITFFSPRDRPPGRDPSPDGNR